MQNLQEKIETRIKNVIVDKLDLEISAEEISDEMPLFDIDSQGNGLDLDSVDALELAVGIKNEFDVKIQNTELSSFANVSSIAKFIREVIEWK